MKEYLEQVLHREVGFTAYKDLERLPLVFRGSVRLHILNFEGQECLMIEPTHTMSLPELRKCYKQIERYTGMRCALYLKKLSYYAKDQLLLEGIPFILENRQLYLPFLGLILNPQNDRPLKPYTQLSFVTQKLLLKALYDGWQGMTVSKAAEALHVSKTTITRCFDEIEVLELPLLQVKSRARKLYADPDKRAMWHLIQPVMRNPLLRVFRLATPIQEGLPLSGTSALAAYSLLSDDQPPTYAFEKAQMGELGTRTWRQAALMEPPVCIAHEVGYILPFAECRAIDPLSITLMLTEEEKADPRVEMSIDEMLEEYVW